MKNVLAIVNPVSGGRDVTPVLQQVEFQLKAKRVRLTVARTRGPGDARRFARDHRDVDAILTMGGDGTVRETVDGLAGRGTPLAVLSTGTENVLARELRMPTTPDAAVRTLLRGNPVRYDVGLIGDRRFLVVAGVGFDAEVVERLARRRNGHIGYSHYILPMLATAWEHRWPHLRVETDGEVVFEDRGFALIGNLARYSLGMRVLAKARPDDGLLDVCAFSCQSLFRLVQYALDIVHLRHVNKAGVVYRACRSVSVSSPDPALVEIDGDPAGALPLTAQALPRDVTLLTDPLVALDWKSD